MRRLVSALFALLALAAPSGAAAQAVEGGPRYDRQVLQAQQQRAAEERASRADKHASPEEARARSESRVRYRGLGPAAARALARDRFPSATTKAVMHGLGLYGGQRVAEWLDDHTARLSDADGAPQGVMTSLAPLRAGPDDKLVDLRLEDRGDRFEAVNPAVAVSIPKDASAGISFLENGVAVRPAVVSQAPGVAVDDRVYWADVATDADLFAHLLPAGYETYLHVRSAAAPERFSFTYDLPHGASLRLDRTQGAPFVEVRRADEVLAVVHPPGAADADGHAIEVDYEVSGNRLTLIYPHRNQDLRYPLLIDPVNSLGQVYDDFVSWSNGNVPFTGWTFLSSPAGYFLQYQNTVNSSINKGRGLYILTYGNSGYSQHQYGQWKYDAPRPNSYIYRAEYHSVPWSAPGLTDT